MANFRLVLFLSGPLLNTKEQKGGYDYNIILEYNVHDSLTF